MGCCLSKKGEENMNKEKKAVCHSGSCRDPPDEVEEEEKVKEVLSETPKLIRSVRSTREEEEEEEKKKKKNNNNKKKKVEEEEADGDDRSEDTWVVLSSLSSSCIAPVVPAKEKKKRVVKEENVDDGKEERKRSPSPSPSPYQQQKPRRKLRSVSGDDHQLQLQQPTTTAKKERVIRRGGALGVEIGCRSGRSPSSPSAAVGRTQSSRVPPCEKFQRDHHGNRSARRSVSPSAKTRVVSSHSSSSADHRSSSAASASAERKGGGHCRSLSAPRVNGRTTTSPQLAPARIRVKEEEEEEEEEKENDKEEGKDSLENPLVSLECFIFL